ncbi:hypothetical protein GBF38_001872 [Nibea albiflora]|uniref:Uncharacterized protein n=1 Tax=Nibea albiflora TaxID=240163 RepID=A0ACB7ED92_NIBAL|nr:hypothetical protein GBF38_001872 [Nibea albiflora]
MQFMSPITASRPHYVMTGGTSLSRGLAYVQNSLVISREYGWFTTLPLRCQYAPGLLETGGGSTGAQVVVALSFAVLGKVGFTSLSVCHMSGI